MLKLQKNPNIDDPIENLYIHVPFCHKKCGYCDYYSIVSQTADYESFLEAIKKEWKITKNYLEKNHNPLRPLKTLYFGGGTPSVLSPQILTQLINYFESEIGFASDIEITMELLKKSGIDNAYYVDLTRKINIPVVRVIIPGMEVFSVDSTRVGKILKPEKFII